MYHRDLLCAFDPFDQCHTPYQCRVCRVIELCGEIDDEYVNSVECCQLIVPMYSIPILL